jgi:hypothetical protein
MLITPLASLALLRIPALTTLFSDTLSVSSIAVVASGTSTITCSAPHGIAVGSLAGVCINDALAPNSITAWSILDAPTAASYSALAQAKDILITLTYPTVMSTGPEDPNLSAFSAFEPWNAFAILNGTTVSAIEGNAQLVSVPDALHIIVRPSGTVNSLPSVPVNAVLLERLERDVIGWHTMTALTTTQLTFTTPSAVARSYTVANPSVAVNVRCWGAVDMAHALSHYTTGDDGTPPTLNRSYLFVCPPRTARISRARNTRTDANAEQQYGSFVEQQLMDGFIIYAIFPAVDYGGAVGCMDKANGEVLTAILRTFNLLSLPFSEYSSPNPYLSTITSHGTALYNRANYVHEYVFEATCTLTQGDGIAPDEVPDMAALDPSGPVQGTGTVPLGNITFDPGVFQKDNPVPLQATINFDDPGVF